MKYSIGYQLPDEYDSTYELCKDYSEHIGSVYFAWGSEPSGRFSLCSENEKEEVCAIQLEELKAIRSLGKKLILLFNANCYGASAASKEFADHIIQITDFLKQETDLEGITTTSPFVAETVKERFGEELKVTASVNMRIGSISAMEQLSNYFDGFYVKKELNRDIANLSKLKAWCDKSGKRLNILVNSGCLNECGFQTFHDNMIAHGGKDGKIESSVKSFPAPCHRYLSELCKEKALEKILQSNFIRPEDIHNYEQLFSEAKLATRMHASARKVVSAYARGRFSGNLLDITEPSYSKTLSGYVLDNRLFPDSWFNRTNGCKKNCHECSFCADIVEQTLCKYEI